MVIPDLMLVPSLAPHVPPSPYCMPLCGSSGSISPSSIFVRIIRANRLKSSSTFSPDRADTSTATGTFDLDAHRDAASLVTSRPSCETVAVQFEPRLIEPPRERCEPAASKGNDDCLLDTLDDVVAGLCDVSLEPGIGICPSDVVGGESESRSCLFPARMTVKLGEANARASMRNVGSALKEAEEAMS
jgi:hypothetical protein